MLDSTMYCIMPEGARYIALVFLNFYATVNCEI